MLSSVQLPEEFLNDTATFKDLDRHELKKPILNPSALAGMAVNIELVARATPVITETDAFLKRSILGNSSEV